MTPYYADDSVTVHHGDCLDVLRELPDASIDAVVTDPPYGIAFMGREWDQPDRYGSTRRGGGARPLTAGPVGVDHLTTRERSASMHAGEYDLSRSAMRSFQAWCEAWATECLRVLKPGGHLLSFGGSRTWHRLTCAVDDAGFEIRDSIAWLYGSGFPKSLDVSKAIDKAADAEREVIGERSYGDGHVQRSKAPRFNGDDYANGEVYTEAEVRPLTAPATEDAQRWQGWGTALKPAHEPVVCARKPFKVVSFEGEVSRLHHLIGALLWQAFTPAKRAAASSPSSLHEQHAAWCVSARVAAVLDTSLAKSVATDTYSSQALGSTCLSIVSSWSAILAALSDQTRTSTTSTGSSTTTALRTLSSLLAPVTSPTTMPPCGCLQSGSPSSAPSAASGSSDEWARWLHTLSASAPVTATEGIALAAASVLAQVAASLSGDPAAGSSVDPSATTGAAERGSSPAFEPIVVARKPLVSTVAANVLEHGTGALNIDACRTATSDSLGGGASTKGSASHTDGWDRPWKNDPEAVAAHAVRVAANVEKAEALGRWPTNVVLDESQAVELDKQTGGTSSHVGKPRGAAAGDGWGMTATGAEYDDAGGASRFFPVFRYVPKAPTSERPSYDRQGAGTGRVTGLGGKVRQCNVCETRAIESGASEPSCGHGDYRCEEPTSDSSSRVAHPTVKPLDLMRWLVRLVTPPGGVVLDPFAGSGTTAEACVIEGFQCIAIEREADYLPLIVQRLSKPIQLGLDLGEAG